MAEIQKPADLTKYIWGQTGQAVRPSNAKINMGWVAEIPPYQFENWVQNRSDTAIAHIVQHGISAWDTATEYLKDRSVVLGSNGNLYKAVQTNTNRNPVSDGGSNWITLFEDIKEAATTNKKGVVELATDAEARGRSSNSVVVTPSGLGSALSSHENASNVHGISAITGLQSALNSLSSQISQQGSQLSSEIDSIDIAGSFSQRKNESGYVKLPNGIMFQWGHGTTSSGKRDTINFPTSFPNDCFQVIAIEGSSSGWEVSGNLEPTLFGTDSLSKSSFQISGVRFHVGGVEYGTGLYFRFIAVGY